MKTVFIIGLRGLFKLRSIPTQSSLSDISKEHGIPLRVFDPAEIEKEKVDIIWVFNLGRILRKPVLQMPSKGCVNLHFGLLPHYRGIMPSFWAHYHGEPFLGITYYKMDEGIDTGPVICQTQIPICSKMNLVDIYQKGFDQAACMIEEVFTCLSGDLLLKQEEAAGPGSYFMMPTWRDIILYKIKFFPYSI
ncbi:MAG: hypothetical protein JW774_11900 [Candidatus Aureabacteria bacterium]|nr:hypothetical protein [Candidatus Auribacterota bacterium]